MRVQYALKFLFLELLVGKLMIYTSLALSSTISIVLRTLIRRSAQVIKL